MKANPIKKNPKLLIRCILHFLIVNSENILLRICLGKDFFTGRIQKKYRN